MPRTLEQIEADIAAIKTNSNWATNESALNAIAAFTIEKNQLTQAQAPQAAPAGIDEYVITFHLYPHWDGAMSNPHCRAFDFEGKPDYSQLLSAIQSIYNIAVFPDYELKGVTRLGFEYTLISNQLVLVNGMMIKILPRYAVVKFHIVTWGVEYNRHRVQRLMKDNNVAGSITRDNKDSLYVVMEHPNREELERVYARVKEVVSEDQRGYCDDAEAVWTWGWGSLPSAVRIHRGTAKRDDGIDSWEEDDDVKSGSTYFNTPITADEIVEDMLAQFEDIPWNPP